jgi:two-component system, OmpR family, sensor histidine kinase KdpD
MITIMTDDYRRPDPDALLQAIKENEPLDKKSGKLKIFFGMAAGVGKTYAMLEAGQRGYREKRDVVIGYIETHKRAETESLVNGLEIIPRKKFGYRGIPIEEFDIDAALQRKPDIILVDELAHTNAEGSRHEKRYQDVEELLESGINVYSTLNIQHLESQADIVGKITGVKIRETIPDSILDIADEIELIDIPPEELLKRLSEGKVYVPEKAGLAMESFFKKSNLNALREISLNYTARLVGSKLRNYAQQKNIKGPWKSGERIMVAVGPGPYSEYIIRWTRHVAFNYNAPWIALYVRQKKELSKYAQELLTKNLNLARELGAEVISIVEEDIVDGLLSAANQNNVTQIVVGKPLRRYVSDFFSRGNIVERLLKSSGDIEIHIVTQPALQTKKIGLFKNFSYTSSLKEYFKGISAVAAVTLIGLITVSFTGYWTIALIYLLCVVMLPLFIGRGPTFVAASISALVWNFLFIPPIFTFRINKLEDALMFFMYFIIAIILGGLTSKLRIKEQNLRVSQEQIAKLYDFSRALGTAFGMDEVISTAVVYIEDYFKGKVAVLLTNKSGNALAAPHPSGSLEILDDELGVAEWSFRNKKPAGLFTNTLPQKGAHYIPLSAPGSVVGVMGIRPDNGIIFSIEQQTLLQNMGYQLASRIERENLLAAGQKAMLVSESERLYKILLNSVSHELRTPLTTITGASSSMLDSAVDLDPVMRKELAVEIKKAGETLNGLVENLLDMSRIDSGRLKLNLDWNDMSDIIDTVLNRLESYLKDHPVAVDCPDNIPLICADYTLLTQALYNIVNNAVIHTKEGTSVSISVAKKNDGISIIIEDEGEGLPENDAGKLFDKFYRAGKNQSGGGLGLGLSISKGIIELHGGQIHAENKKPKGARFIIHLPVEMKEKKEQS